jgi:beta-galactosidase
VDVSARWIQVSFTALPPGKEASICEFGAFAEPAESQYFAPTYTYRLRWNDVVYEPGELKAVAYANGKKIGSTTIRTASEPASIRLTPDRKKLKSSGYDLCYVLVEAVDKAGTLCPLARNLVRFQIDGPGEIAAVGNGNPLSLEPFHVNERQLFYGKAMLVVRSVEGQSGTMRIHAVSDGLSDAWTSCDIVPQFTGAGQ